ncbi:AIPR family protein [Bradyrhizobium diazoefficiens]|nr:AIPR family protein [Bradyrhizobium diazoefficiens]MBR0892177.1 AIPR family protein [Bradyrhizobium diazoefficiens]MBR0923876.1 AIPR family protein [Bradyrhizobium diazoefficiens]
MFYERRKGEYRELKKPVDHIVSIQTLARAVMALLLQQPNNAYATPSRVLKSDYTRIFNESHNRDMFITSILICRQVESYLTDRTDLKQWKSVLRYFVSMAVACTYLKKASPPTDKELAALLPLASKAFIPPLFAELTTMAMKTYTELGGTESVAKGPEMRAEILKQLAFKLTPQGSLGL